VILPVDADARAHLEGVPLDAGLKLLIAVVGQPDRTAGQEERGQRDIEREWGMIASAESAAHIGKMRFDVRRLERIPRVAEHIGELFSGVVWRLHAEHELKILGARIVPAEPAFRLEEHRIDGLRLEFAVEHQQRRVGRGQVGPDLLAISRRLGVRRPGLVHEWRPYRTLGVLKFAGIDPAGEDR
jgi:hypothetical protein